MVAPGDAPGTTRYAPCAFLLDPLLRVIAMAPIERIGELLDLLRRLPEPALHTGFEVPAPVLVLPRVMEPEFCRRLIAVHEAGGGEESGFMVERGGKTVGVYDPATKKRRDQEITEEPLRAALRARVIPTRVDVDTSTPLRRRAPRIRAAWLRAIGRGPRSRPRRAIWRAAWVSL